MKFEDIINNIKDLKGIKRGKRTDKPVRLLLEMSESAFSQAKKQKPPYERIIKWGIKEGHSLNFIFSGEGLPEDIVNLWGNANKQARQSAIDCLRAGQIEEKKEIKKNTG